MKRAQVGRPNGLERETFGPEFKREVDWFPTLPIPSVLSVCGVLANGSMASHFPKCLSWSCSRRIDREGKWLCTKGEI